MKKKAKKKAAKKKTTPRRRYVRLNPSFSKEREERYKQERVRHDRFVVVCERFAELFERYLDQVDRDRLQ